MNSRKQRIYTEIEKFLANKSKKHLFLSLYPNELRKIKKKYSTIRFVAVANKDNFSRYSCVIKKMRDK